MYPRPAGPWVPGTGTLPGLTWLYGNGRNRLSLTCALRLRRVALRPAVAGKPAPAGALNGVNERALGAPDRWGSLFPRCGKRLPNDKWAIRIGLRQQACVLRISHGDRAGALLACARKAKRPPRRSFCFFLAEAVRFELTNGFPRRQFSSPWAFLLQSNTYRIIDSATSPDYSSITLCF
jgi:hypothetical protein